MEQIVKIGKHSSADVVCWKVDAPSLTPNTEIVINDPGIVVIVKVGGNRKIQTKGQSTVFALFNPGKAKKALCGNKKYNEACEIIAIDQSSEFFAEWAIGEDNPLSCKDLEFGIESQSLATGQYSYKIVNYVDFTKSVPMTDGKITRGDLREFLRADTTGIIRSVLTTELLQHGMTQTRLNLAVVSEKIAKEINNLVESKGMQVNNVAIKRIDYTYQFKKAHADLVKVQVERTIKDVENDIKKDEILVGKAENEVLIPRIDAVGKAAGQINGGERSGGKVIYCPDCGKKNVGAKFCSGCGKELPND